MNLAAKVTLAILVAGAAAHAADAESEIRQAEASWAAAVKARDFARLERILSDRLIYNHSSGVVEDKKQYLNRLREGKQRYDTIEQNAMEVRAYGDTGITSSRARMTGKSDTRFFDDQLLMLHVWVKQGGAWILAAHQTTKLAQ